MYISRVRLGKNISLSELLILWDSIIASIISVYPCSFKIHSGTHKLSYVPV